MTKLSYRSIVTILVLLLAACAGAPAVPTATPTQLPVATTAPATTPTSAPTAILPTVTSVLTVSAPTDTPLPNVPRNQTLVLGWSLSNGIGITNPWATAGYTHQEGNNLLWEGLSYYGIFSDKEIPWLADKMEYTKPDFTELTIHLNKQAKWSDGVPVTAQDVVYTFEEQLHDDKLPYHSDFNQYVQDIKQVDDYTVVVTFKIPAPRFKFEVLTLKFDTGIEIVPEHILSQQPDVNGFAGGLAMPHSGPYNLVAWNADRKVYDLRLDWWAVQAGLISLPAVKRVIVLNISATGGALPYRIVNGDFDTSADLRGQVISNVLKQNPKITTYSGDAPPYGYLDWWPNSLWVNTQLPPYDDARVRRALSLAIDRDKLDELLYNGAPIATIYPFPLYPALERFVNTPAVKQLETKYAPRKFDLAESARLMTAAGFHKNSNDLWEKDGETVDATIDAFEAIHSDIASVLVEMLKRGGFNASAYFGADAYDHMNLGYPGLYLFGHGGSLIDPYATLEIYHSRHSKPAGTASGGYFSRYKNPEYDAILDQMAVLDTQDPKFQGLAVKALEIYWRDVIDIPLVQWLHRIPYNQTYWVNWPTRNNLAMGTNGAFWAQTGMLVITSLKPAP